MIKKTLLGTSTLLSVLALTACVSSSIEKTHSTSVSKHSVQSSTSGIKVTKSETDQREYEYIQLDNQLKIMLVSDPTLERSAVALAVGVGSYHENDGFWGMAHYLEHMLFLGTEKFPVPGEYSKFISKNGGSSNAYTDMEHTNYMSAVKDNAYEELLARFSDYFKKPLLLPEYADKERNAVHSEWSMKGVSDGVILGELNGLSLNPKHPVSRFTWGNLDTLTDQSGKTLHQALTEFYEQHYSANRMTASLVSPRSISELKQLAKQYFGDIPDKNLPSPKITIPALTEKESGKIVRYQPQKDVKWLQMRFTIDNNIGEYKSKPNEYLSYLINSQMPGTLSATLREQGLVESIGSYDDPAAFMSQGEFVIYAYLTDSGVKQQGKIIASVMQYLDLIKQQGIEKKYYQEIKQSLANSFRFQEKYNEYSYASNIAAQLLFYPPESALSHAYEYTQFDAAAIQQVLSQLSLDNVRLFYIDQSQPVDTPMTYFKGQYSIDDITPQMKENWKKSASNINLKLPSYNRLMPENFELVDKKYIEKPQRVYQNNSTEVYLGHSEYFDKPKGLLKVELNSGLAYQSVANQLSQLVLQQAITTELTGISAEASAAGMSLSIGTGSGISLYSNGFSDRQFELLLEVLSKIKTFKLTESEFQVALSTVKSNLENLKKDTLLSQTFSQYRELLNKNVFASDTLLENISSIKPQQVDRLLNALLKEARVKVFAFGNYQSDELTQFTKNLESILPSDRQVKDYFKTDYVQLDANDSYHLNLDAPQNDTALVDSYWQPHTWQNDAAGRVLRSAISRDMFEQLRTQEQLGYSVGFYSSRYDQQISYAWYIQTPVKGPKAVMARIKAFQQQQNAVIQQMTLSEFEVHRESVLVKLTAKPKNISEEAAYLLTDWSLENDNFDSKQALIDAVKSLKLSDIQQLYSKIINRQNMGHLLVQIRGANFKATEFTLPKNSLQIKSVVQFKNKN
ncbi:insulinase family protein [Aliikangiella maris]|uniref:Protease 3 n=2 Tax=Aliikangiella maris TaxID=3162458 RepID=A0ABV3MU46_9GAMM